MVVLSNIVNFFSPRSDQTRHSCLCFLSFKWKGAWSWTSVFGLSNWQVCPSTAVWRRTVRRWPTLMRRVFSFPLRYTHVSYDSSANTSPLTPLSCDKQAAGLLVGLAAVQYLPNIRKQFFFFLISTMNPLNKMHCYRYLQLGTNGD